ncbi:histidine kinase [Virgisporangium aliadipatigenens]|uniref:Oxygen sensor histidine kinase NreB n=1 Tax=Virgisporangium aliadipatigenens TaxID=741659 RepID=A0A8J3YFS2_9ACTN|nr:sensor histidine kinase [Virgisporangium aliadipatigenens]GIJ44359.1 histidine kinase [Virgisporangium aliadipatigenens]
MTDPRRLHRRILEPLPYVLLGVGAALALLTAGQTPGERLTTAALVAGTAGWIFGMYTRAPRDRVLWMAGYVTVQLGLMAVLVMRQPIFFVFAILGFVQAYELLPPIPGFVSIFAHSAVMNLLPFGFPDTVEWLVFALTIVVLQTAVIGWFGYLSRRFDVQGEERRQTVARLEAALAENAGLHAQLLAQAREAGVTDERQRMAREIHDTLAQGLTGIITHMQAAERTTDEKRRRHHTGQVIALARESLAAARRSVAALGPPELDDARLPEALGALAARWSAGCGVPARARTTGDPRTLPTEVEITLFRVAQEALANVARHAAATRTAVTLSYMDDAVMLDVRDDGVGFDPHAVDASSFGLRTVRQRLERVAGTLVVESAPGEGTALNATVPAP